MQTVQAHQNQIEDFLPADICKIRITPLLGANVILPFI